MTPESGARMGVSNRCPVCQAGFRGARTCSRCGADLEKLMHLTAKAWNLRERARAKLKEGEVEAARKLAAKSLEIQPTASGAALQQLSEWLRPAGEP